MANITASTTLSRCLLHYLKQWRFPPCRASFLSLVCSTYWTTFVRLNSRFKYQRRRCTENLCKLSYGTFFLYKGLPFILLLNIRQETSKWIFLNQARMVIIIKRSCTCLVSIAHESDLEVTLQNFSLWSYAHMEDPWFCRIAPCILLNNPCYLPIHTAYVPQTKHETRPY